VSVAAAQSERERLTEEWSRHRDALWALCYRLTGVAADADDLVQETFARALAGQPRTDQPLKAWLVRVAVNLARDLLRSRKRRGYDGPWLPSPVDDARLQTSLGESPEARYDTAESATFAFLLAAEALTPLQRAVLVLRDVAGYSVREVADALETSENAVKVTHHRARKAMESYERRRCRPDAARAERTAAAIESIVRAILSGDAAALEALLARDVRALSDSGGEYVAARSPIVGARNVARFFVGLAAKGGRTTAEARHVNGLPALLIATEPKLPNQAPRFLLRLDVDTAGRVTDIHAVLAGRKLASL
jgi:RNA polymerase sigma-70 factor (ECF subfamily)